MRRMMVKGAGFRLSLSSIEESDADAIAKGANSEGISDSIPYMPHPYTLGHAEAFIGFAKARYESGEGFHLAVRIDGGRLIGMCAIDNIEKGSCKGELGYWICNDLWGIGYGKEAARLMMRFGFGTLGLNRIYSKVLADNARSISMLSSLGFKREGVIRDDVMRMGALCDSILFGILKREYKDGADIQVSGYK